MAPKRILSIVLVGLFIAGPAYNAVKTVVDGRRYPAPGTLVNVGDHRLHLFCEGSGSPTVILEAGAGGWSIHMRRLQESLRDSVRACAYDRAGLGWSDPSGGPYDAGASVEDLRRLVDSARIPKPFVLVGHSLGANIAQIYASKHPEDLRAAILLDPGTPDDLLEDFHKPDSLAEKIHSCGWKCDAIAGAAHLGLMRLAAQAAGSKYMTAGEKAEYRAGLARAEVARTSLGSLVFVPKTAVQTKAAARFGDLNVTVLFSANTRRPEGKETVADVARWHALKLDQMRTLLQGTTHPRGPIEVPGATHISMILEDSARALVVREVLRAAIR
ncbi:MAG TPA: alpha/beta hydrolase [Gemmatimonadaceae bacterium]|nr:alpha/beta hydrolase [Gemmatimonadaceae bacterium]